MLSSSGKRTGDCRVESMRLRLLIAAVALCGLLAVGLPGAYARGGSDPGVTPGSILIGGTVPLTGDEVAYAAVARGAEAYFRSVNARGGVRGRQIEYRYVDDAYNPADTARKTRELVQDDKVFAIFNSVGTEHVLAVRPYLNEVGVPQLFVGSGHSSLALERKRYPWSMGYLPRFAGEGALYGRYVARTRPRAKIAVLHEDSEYGRDMFAGLRRGLGKLSPRIRAVQTYDLSDTDLNSQVARLKSSGADTIMIFALPTQTIQAFLAVHKLGWHPRIFVNSVSIDPFVMEVVLRNTSKRLVEGTISSSFLKDPTDPALARDPGVRLYKQILRRYLPSAKVKEVAHLYGMAVAYTMVDALRGAGAQPTRASLLRAATHLKERANPFFVKGIPVQTGPNDYFPVERTRMLRFRSGRWHQFGGLVSVR
jgi:ABC-type branched-subunit amino acid transport system substrate-binding protein